MTDRTNWLIKGPYGSKRSSHQKSARRARRGKIKLANRIAFPHVSLNQGTFSFSTSKSALRCILPPPASDIISSLHQTSSSMIFLRFCSSSFTFIRRSFSLHRSDRYRRASLEIADVNLVSSSCRRISRAELKTTNTELTWWSRAANGGLNGPSVASPMPMLLKRMAHV